MAKTKIAIPANGQPLMANYAEASDNTSTTRSRRNRGSVIERTDKYINIDQSPLPFKFSFGYYGNFIDARDCIILCQKAYFNVAIVRNIIDLMTEFSVGDIYFRDGSKLSREFFEAWWRKIGGRDLQDRHYREYYRGGNVFFYRFESTVQPGDVRRLISNFGLTTVTAIENLEVPKMKLPVRYVLLNPADIMFAGGVSFYSGIYYKRITDFELQRLRKPQSDEDVEVLKSLPAETQKIIKNTKVGTVNLQLDAEKVLAIFYKKQDYEPFAAPLVWPVLEDLNAKIELKRLDMAIARTQQQVILLITTGAEPDKGGVNNANIVALQQLFLNESVGRVLVADYTTKAEFVVPKIGDILTQEKYQQLEQDINLGLNNILIGGEKFANQSVKVEVFMARLEHGRRIFLEQFLIPEIRRISKSLGFKSSPTPYYDEIQLKNNDIRDKIYVRLAELGLLTPDEAFVALDNGRLPDPEQSQENQTTYKKERDKGLYKPLIGGAKDGAGDGTAGRPDGTPSPQTTKRIGPIGTKASFSLKSLTGHMMAAKALGNEVAAQLKTKFKKKTLNEHQVSVATDIAKVIIANEEPDKWLTKVSDYIKEPVDKNTERIKEVQALAAEFQVDDYLASLLLISKRVGKNEQLTTELQP